MWSSETVRANLAWLFSRSPRIQSQVLRLCSEACTAPTESIFPTLHLDSYFSVWPRFPVLRFIVIIVMKTHLKAFTLSRTEFYFILLKHFPYETFLTLKLQAQKEKLLHLKCCTVFSLHLGTACETCQCSNYRRWSFCSFWNKCCGSHLPRYWHHSVVPSFTKWKGSQWVNSISSFGKPNFWFLIAIYSSNQHINWTVPFIREKPTNRDQSDQNE